MIKIESKGITHFIVPDKVECIAKNGKHLTIWFSQGAIAFDFDTEEEADMLIKEIDDDRQESC